MIRALLNILAPIVRGWRAFTVQPYTEANVKNGLQYYTRRAFRGAAGATTGGAFSGIGDKRYIYFETGSKPVIVKNRTVLYIGEEFKLSIYVGPTINAIAGPMAITNYRSDGGAVPTSVLAAGEVLAADIVSLGVELGDPEYYFGAQTGAQRDPQSILEGRERILPSNTKFMVEVELTAGNAGRFQYFIDWFEGKPDLPVPEI